MDNLIAGSVHETKVILDFVLDLFERSRSETRKMPVHIMTRIT